MFEFNLSLIKSKDFFFISLKLLKLFIYLFKKNNLSMFEFNL